MMKIEKLVAKFIETVNRVLIKYYSPGQYYTSVVKKLNIKRKFVKTWGNFNDNLDLATWLLKLVMSEKKLDHNVTHYSGG